MTATMGSSKASNGYKYSLEGDSLSQDLHFKMSKKIAQLTKVIYVLNTRNDDHDIVVENLTEQHKREIRQTVADMSDKVEAMENRIRSQTSDQLRVQELQGTIRSYEILLEQTKKDFLAFKEDASKNTKERDEQHILQLTRLNDKLESLEQSYKDLLDSSESSLRRVEAERDVCVKEVEARYEGLLSELREDSLRRERHLEGLLETSRRELEAELGKTREHLQSATHSRERSLGEHERELREMRATCEQRMAEASQEARALREFEAEESAARLRDFQEQMEEHKKSVSSQLEKYMATVKENEALLEASVKETEGLRAEIKRQSTLISKKQDEVEALKERNVAVEKEVRDRRHEAEGLKKAEEALSGELQQKTKQVRELRASMEAVLQKLAAKELELLEAQARAEDARKESKDMEHCTKSVSVDYEIQLQTLRRGLEELMNEKSAQRQAMERLNLNHEIEQGEMQNRLKSEHSAELEKVSKKLERDWQVKEKALKDEIQKLKEENQLKLEDERSKASKMIDKFKAENEQIRTDSGSKLKSKDKQISSLETTIVERDKEIKGVSLQNKSLKESVSNLKKENTRLTSSVTEKDIFIENLTAEINATKESLGEQILENDKIQRVMKSKVKEDMNEKYNQLSADLDKKWADTLRRETGRLRNDMLENFAKEKENAIENIERIKSEEIKSVQKEFEEMKAELLGEICLYKERLSKLEIQLVAEKEEVNKYNLVEIQNLKSKLEMEEKSHILEVSKISKKHTEQLEEITRQFEKDRLMYITDMEALLEATNRDWIQKYETKINSLNQENDQTMRQRMEEMMTEHNWEMKNQLARLQLQMTDAQQDVMEELRNQIKVLQQKNHFNEDQIKVQAENNRTESEKMRAAKLVSEQNYERLDRNLQEVLQENNFLKKQLEEFSDDFHRSQKEFAEKIRQKENEINYHYEQILHSSKANFEEDSRQTLQDFNKAQNLFKDKIKELSSKLFEVEERYQSRPSRDEDVEMIETLRAQLRTSEKEIERMNEEKKFFQLELMNRETNFNKIFNASPNVGKIDPTGHGAIKTKKVSTEKIKNIPKLTPLPGSPFHDDPINPARPLPPPRHSIDAS